MDFVDRMGNDAVLGKDALLTTLAGAGCWCLSLMLLMMLGSFFLALQSFWRCRFGRSLSIFFFFLSLFLSRSPALLLLSLTQKKATKNTTDD